MRERASSLGPCCPNARMGFAGGSAGKESGCHKGDLGWEDLLEKGKATCFSLLAWRIPWTVQSIGSQSWTRLSGFDFSDALILGPQRADPVTRTQA